MIPLFEKLGFSLGHHQNAKKIVVKSQIYEFSDFTQTYEGRDHKEGLSEDGIIAVALYYPHVDADLKGGDLHVSTVVHGRCGNKMFKSNSVPVSMGTVIVIKNITCTHRVGKISGNGSRMVVAFFLSEKTIEGSNKVVVNMDRVAEIFLRKMENSVKIKLPNEVRKKILEYVVGSDEEVERRYESFYNARMKVKTYNEIQFAMAHCD